MAHQGDSDGADRLFVTKIPPHVTKEEISTHFARFGVTTDVYVPMAPGMQNHKGIAFVSFSDAITAQLAINSGPHEIGGSEVVVDFAAPRGGGPPGARAAAPAAPAYGGGGNFPGGVDPASQEGRLFVTKVAPALQKEHLREHFAQFGELTDVYMPTAPGAAVHKGICFVSYASPASMTLALQSSPHEIHGYPVVVDVAAPRGQAPPRPAGFAAPAAVPQYAAVPQVQYATPAYFTAPAYGMAAAGYAQPAMQVAPLAAPPMGGGTLGTPIPGRMFVTRVTPDMTKDDLQLYFQQYGALTDVYVPGGGKGIAFVTYQDTNVAAQVLAAKQHEIKPGQAVLVDQALDRPAMPGKGGGKGGFHGGAAPTAAVAFGGAPVVDYGAALAGGQAVRFQPY